ncbi:hypothetical protein HanIR_Chr09g0434951 [Helianthus annuus]|nr:hypothetical protein HanIR_Chr09g0434951 [Helianthus annuus]
MFFTFNFYLNLFSYFNGLMDLNTPNYGNLAAVTLNFDFGSHHSQLNTLYAVSPCH